MLISDVTLSKFSFQCKICGVSIRFISLNVSYIIPNFYCAILTMRSFHWYKTSLSKMALYTGFHILNHNYY